MTIGAKTKVRSRGNGQAVVGERGSGRGEGLPLLLILTEEESLSDTEARLMVAGDDLDALRRDVRRLASGYTKRFAERVGSAASGK